MKEWALTYREVPFQRAVYAPTVLGLGGAGHVQLADRSGAFRVFESFLRTSCIR